MKKKIRLFTLIELLVVMTIISILSAMLFPQLRDSIEMGRRTECGANLKSIGVAANTYLKNNYSFFPSETGDWVSQSTGAPLNKYVGSAEQLALCPSESNAVTSSYGHNEYLEAASADTLIYPSFTILMGESGGIEFLSDRDPGNTQYHTDDPIPKYNYVFTDGHVEYFTAVEPEGSNKGYIDLNDDSEANWTLTQDISPVGTTE